MLRNPAVGPATQCSSAGRIWKRGLFRKFCVAPGALRLTLRVVARPVQVEHPGALRFVIGAARRRGEIAGNAGRTPRCFSNQRSQ